METEGRSMCVTGAGGFLASWLIKLLLTQGYNVNGTLRNPEDDKNAHLRNLESAAENLKLFKADVLDFDSILAAVKGCDGVLHVASPVPSTPVPNPEDQVIDESCWSDKEYCRTTNNWYYYSKTVAEAEAFEYAKKSGLDVVSVCPSHVVGPMLQRATNASSLGLIKLLKEGYEEIQNNLRMMVDVRDVAEAIKLVYEKPEIEGRYICTAYMIKTQDLVQILKEIYPKYNYPKSFTEGKNSSKISSEKLQRLGWKYRPLKETLVDSVEHYKQAGLLHS